MILGCGRFACHAVFYILYFDFQHDDMGQHEGAFSQIHLYRNSICYCTICHEYKCNCYATYFFILFISTCYQTQAKLMKQTIRPCFHAHLQFPSSSYLLLWLFMCKEHGFLLYRAIVILLHFLINWVNGSPLLWF